jgi:hypothetical protein
MRGRRDKIRPLDLHRRGMISKIFAALLFRPSCQEQSIEEIGINCNDRYRSHLELYDFDSSSKITFCYLIHKSEFKDYKQNALIYHIQNTSFLFCSFSLSLPFFLFFFLYQDGSYFIQTSQLHELTPIIILQFEND